jgi:uncharacterized protein DUF222/HNH endonuclease
MSTREELVARGERLHADICRAQRELFCVIAEVDGRKAWADDGAMDLVHWVRMQFGISDWKARRWIAAARALEDLPVVEGAFTSGHLGIDKVVELTRFATPGSEDRLLRWAMNATCAALRRRADVATRTVEEARDAERARFVRWWYFEENSRFGLSGELPAADGAVVARALERLSGEIPAMPEEDGEEFRDARRADALVALTTGTAGGGESTPTTVIVHAQIEGLSASDGGCELDGGPAVAAETARRLLCEGRSQLVIEDAVRNAVGVGRLSREPTPWMLRQLRYRDGGCTFPGCGSRRFAKAHHIVWWSRGGRTDMDNLVVVCTFHHKLVHEFGWSIERDPDGTVRWLRPDGTSYRAGPAPPFQTSMPTSDQMAG